MNLRKAHITSPPPQRRMNNTETDQQLRTQHNLTMQAEALELVLLAFAVIVGILLIRGDTFVLSIGRGMVWRERAPRGGDFGLG